MSCWARQKRQTLCRWLQIVFCLTAKSFFLQMVWRRWDRIFFFLFSFAWHECIQRQFRGCPFHAVGWIRSSSWKVAITILLETAEQDVNWSLWSDPIVFQKNATALCSSRSNAHCPFSALVGESCQLRIFNWTRWHMKWAFLGDRGRKCVWRLLGLDPHKTLETSSQRQGKCYKAP